MSHVSLSLLSLNPSDTTQPTIALFLQLSLLAYFRLASALCEYRRLFQSSPCQLLSLSSYFGQPQAWPPLLAICGNFGPSCGFSCLLVPHSGCLLRHIGAPSTILFLLHVTPTIVDSCLPSPLFGQLLGFWPILRLSKRKIFCSIYSLIKLFIFICQ